LFGILITVRNKNKSKRKKMKTSIKIFVGFAAVALLLSSTGAVFADSIEASTFGSGYGYGSGEGQNGQLEPYMEAAIADSLGLTVEEVDALLASGETHYTIALKQGLTAEEFTAIFESARITALDLAAKDGIVINQYGRNKNSSGRLGGSQFDPENCTGGTCTSQPMGTGIRRGAHQ
jgi:hypothetical protein